MTTQVEVQEPTKQEIMRILNGILAFRMALEGRKLEMRSNPRGVGRRGKRSDATFPL